VASDLAPQSERFHAPGPNSQGVTRQFDASAHGTTGPVDVSYPPFVSQQFTGFFTALAEFNVTQAQDLGNGRNQGISWSASSVDPAHQTRATSDTAYSKPATQSGWARTSAFVERFCSDRSIRHTWCAVAPIAASRPNLVVLTSAQAIGIVWAALPANASANATQTATGVSFVVGGGGQTFTASASGEVVLSAGSIQSPQILELSGVGDPAVLGPLGIDTVVNLPGVGANLQDHPAVVNVYKLKPGFQSLDTLTGAALVAAVADYSTGQGILTQALSTLAYVPGRTLLSSADQRAAIRLMAQPAASLPRVQQVAMAAFYAAGAPMLEFLPINVYFGSSSPEPNTSYISLATCLQHSFSRGTVHVTSADPLIPPAIDPNCKAAKRPLDRDWSGTNLIFFFLCRSCPSGRHVLSPKGRRVHAPRYSAAGLGRLHRLRGRAGAGRADRFTVCRLGSRIRSHRVPSRRKPLSPRARARPLDFVRQG